VFCAIWTRLRHELEAARTQGSQLI